MRYFDFIACIFFADIISAGIVTGNVLLAISGLALYQVYELMRLYSEDADE